MVIDAKLHYIQYIWIFINLWIQRRNIMHATLLIFNRINNKRLLTTVVFASFSLLTYSPPGLSCIICGMNSVEYSLLNNEINEIKVI